MSIEEAGAKKTIPPSVITELVPLSLIQQKSEDHFERIQARINVLYGTNRFESLCDGDTSFQTILILIKKKVWQLQILPASLTASQKLVDIFEIYSMNTKYSDSNTCIGLEIGTCEDEVIIEFMFSEQYDYFRKVFEVFIHKPNPQNTYMPEPVKEILSFFEDGEEGEGEEHRIIDMIREEKKEEEEEEDGEEEELKKKDEETLKERKERNKKKINFNQEFVENWMKMMYISNEKKQLTDLFTVLEEVGILKKFRTYLLKQYKENNSLEILYQLILSYESNSNISINPSFLKLIVDVESIRRIVKISLTMMIESEMKVNSLDFFRVLDKKIKHCSEEKIDEETGMYILTSEKLKELEEELLSSSMWMWNESYCRDDILSRLLFENSLESRIHNLSKQFSEFEEKSLKESNNKDLMSILKEFNRVNDIRLEEICFDIYLRVNHRDIYNGIRDIYYFIQPIESKYFDALDSLEDTESKLNKYRAERDANARIIEEFEDYDDNDRVQLMLGINKFLEVEISVLEKKIPRYRKIIEKNMNLLDPLDEKLKMFEVRAKTIREMFMISKRRLKWIEEYIYTHISLESLGRETDFKVQLVVSMFQFRKSIPKGNYLGMPEPVLSYLTIGSSRLHFFRDVSLVMISQETDVRYGRELDYEEIIAVKLMCPLIMTSTLKVYDMMIELAERVNQINVSAYFKNKGNKKKKRRKDQFTVDSSFDFVKEVYDKHLNMSSLYDEVKTFIENFVKDATRNLQLIKLNQVRKLYIRQSFYDKFLVLLGDILDVPQDSTTSQSSKSRGGKSIKDIMVFNDHRKLDELVKQFMDFDDQFILNHPGIYSLLQGFDSAFWLIEQKKGGLKMKDETGKFYDSIHNCPFLSRREAGEEDEGQDETWTKCAEEDLSEKHTKEVNLAIIELLQTEEFFVHNLETFNENFIIPMEPKIVAEEEGEGEEVVEESKVCSNPELAEELKKIRTVIEIDVLFLSSLKSSIFQDADDNITRLMETIEKILYHSYALKGYAAYMCAYAVISDYWTQEEANNPNFKSFIQSVEGELRKKKLRVCTARSFLLQPIQRIPRIRMLIERVVKRVGKDFKEYRMLMKAFEKIEYMAKYSNSKLREMKNLQKLREVEAGLEQNFNIVVPNVKLMKDEELKIRKFKLKNINKLKVIRICRVMILSHMILVLYKKKKTFALDISKAVVMKQMVDGDDNEGAKFGLSIKGGGFPYGFVLCFENVKKRDDWGKVISEIIGRNARRRNLKI